MTAEPVPANPRTIDVWLAAHGEGLIALRRNLHAHPELSGEEHATSELVSERLEVAGLTTRGLGSGTGLLCDIEPEGTLGPRFALRADLDALAMSDEKDVHYRSQVPGVSHACGHDVHTTVMLGTALYFAHHPERLPGRLRFIFQPAEERVPGGALDVLADGGLDGVAAIVGLHCAPQYDVGQFGLRAGAITSAADMATITLSGPGGHTARPELTVDMVGVAARLVRELPRRVAAMLDDPTDVKIVFGAIRAGDAANVIPAHSELKASIRTPSAEVWDKIEQIFERALRDVLAESGAEFSLDYVDGVPPVVNDVRVTELLRSAVTGEFGSRAVVEAVQSWGGDDFAWYTRELPGAYVRLGVHDPASTDPRLDLHVGHFDVDERAISLGVRLMVATVEEFFADHARTDAHD